MYSETELFPNAVVGNAVHEYCIAHSDPVAEHIDKHREDTIKWNASDAGMMINTLQSQFMQWFIKAMGVKRILEIGCFTGYSALSFAEALKGVPGAEITTLDLPGPNSNFAREAFKKYLTPSHPPVNLIEGPAAESLRSLGGKQYDLVFLDADKNGYVSYFHTVLELGLLAPNGVLIADNTLKRGLVADSSANNPASKPGEDGSLRHLEVAAWLDEFNKVVKSDSRVESVLVPLFDGLNFVKLVKK